MSPVMKRSLWLLALGCLFYGMSARGQAPSPTGSVPTNLWMRLDGLDLRSYQSGRTPTQGSLQHTNGVLQIYDGGWHDLVTVEDVLAGVSYFSTNATGIYYPSGSLSLSNGFLYVNGHLYVTGVTTNAGGLVVLGSVDGGTGTLDSLTLQDGEDGDLTFTSGGDIIGADTAGFGGAVTSNYIHVDNATNDGTTNTSALVEGAVEADYFKGSAQLLTDVPGISYVTSTSVDKTLSGAELDLVEYADAGSNSGSVGAGPKTQSLTIQTTFEANTMVQKLWYGLTTTEIYGMKIWDWGPVTGGFITEAQVTAGLTAGTPMWDSTVAGADISKNHNTDGYWLVWNFGETLTFTAGRAYGFTLLSQPTSSPDDHNVSYYYANESSVDGGTYHWPAQKSGEATSSTMNYYHTDWENDITTGGFQNNTFAFNGYFIIAPDPDTYSFPVQQVQQGSGMTISYDGGTDTATLEAATPTISVGYGTPMSILHSNFTSMSHGSTTYRRYFGGSASFSADRSFYWVQALSSWTFSGIYWSGYYPTMGGNFYRILLRDQDGDLLAEQASSIEYTGTDWIVLTLDQSYDLVLNEIYIIEIRADATETPFYHQIPQAGGTETWTGKLEYLGGSAQVGDPGTYLPLRSDAQVTEPGMILIEGDSGYDASAVLKIGTGLETYLDSGVPIITGWTTNVPSTAADSGTPGQKAYDGSYLYIATGTNEWKRVGIATW